MPEEPVLIQPVESPVICKPYYEPTHYWEYDRAIPYEYEGVQHHFEPDYLVRLKNGKTIVLEMKGEENDQDRAKHQAARRWIAAVNNWGRLGVWDFAVCRDPQRLPRLVARYKGGT
jgi:hypothetical protein